MVFLVSCSASKSIVGSWTDDSGSSFNFYEDGTLTINSGLLSTSGTYTFVDNDTMEVQLDGLLGIAGATVYDVEISKGELRLETDGQILILTKSD
jgi:hypothetical protein